MMAKAGTTLRKPLSAAFVRTAKQPGKYNDNSGMGLFLWVKPNASRFWVQRITIAGKRRDIGLGSPPVVSLAEARDLALENKRTVRRGGDPLQDKRKDTKVPTFAQAARSFHESHAPSWKNEKHAAQVLATLETYAFPALGEMKVSEVTSANVLSVLSPIWLEKAETARRVLQRITSVMKFSIANGWRSGNPAEDVKEVLPRQSAKVKHRRALPYTDVAGCIATVHGSRAWAATKLAFEFLVLTAARSGEVRGATWDEITLHGAASIEKAAEATWIVPAERMKANVTHRVPLSRRAIELLGEAARSAGPSGLIFPSQREKPLSDMTLSKLVKELGFDADIHGFRTSFRTWAQEQTNFPREIAETALAHTIGNKVEAAYARSDHFEKRRNMMETWARYLSTSSGDHISPTGSPANR